MLSKLIYRGLTIALLALTTQVGISQNYVDAETALVILEDAIEQLEAEIDNGPVYTGSFQLQNSALNNSNKLDLQLMETVKQEIDDIKDVKTVMDNWYQNADSQVAERKLKLTLALDKVKELLS
ncbi:MAG: hypothetical protein AAGA77_15675 [Bacteroidota bacterium]